MDKKCILIGITGSIAGYKIYELARSLRKQNFDVQVLLSKNAERFVSKLSFQEITNRPVYSSEWEEGMLHIDCKNIAELFIVAPATANCIGKLANGIADDLISSTYLALKCPTWLAPAMNPNMYSHLSVQRNLKVLKADGVKIIPPDSGEVLCGDTGQGKMSSIHTIKSEILEWKKRNP